MIFIQGMAVMDRGIIKDTIMDTTMDMVTITNSFVFEFVSLIKIQSYTLTLNRLQDTVDQDITMEVKYWNKHY